MTSTFTFESPCDGSCLGLQGGDRTNRIFQRQAGIGRVQPIEIDRSSLSRLRLLSQAVRRCSGRRFLSQAPALRASHALVAITIRPDTDIAFGNGSFWKSLALRWVQVPATAMRALPLKSWPRSVQLSTVPRSATPDAGVNEKPSEVSGGKCRWHAWRPVATQSLLVSLGLKS